MAAKRNQRKVDMLRVSRPLSAAASSAWGDGVPALAGRVPRHHARAPMSPKLPPPDPYESLELAPTGGQRVPAPTAVFVMGPASPESDRAADGILDLRPGVLIVVA